MAEASVSPSDLAGNGISSIKDNLCDTSHPLPCQVSLNPCLPQNFNHTFNIFKENQKTVTSKTSKHPRFHSLGCLTSSTPT